MTPAAQPTSLRDGYQTFIARHEIAWELAFGALAVVYVVIGFAGDEADAAVKPVLSGLELAITAVFVAEFATSNGAALTLAARPGEPVVLAIDDEQFEFPGSG